MPLPRLHRWRPSFRRAIAFGGVAAAMLVVWPFHGRVSGRPSPEGPPAGPRLLVAEMQGAQTTLYAIAATDPSYRQALARISHRDGYGIRAALSPDRSRLAYVYLPSDGREPATNATLAVVDLASGAVPTVLLSGVDLHSAPVWSPDGRQVACLRITRQVESSTRSAAGETIRIVAVDTTIGGSTVLVTETQALGLYPFAWSARGVYYARIAPSGTDIMVRDPSAAEAYRLLHASDGVAREFKLSPDGGRIAFAAPLAGAPSQYEVKVADATTGAVETVPKTRTLPALAWRAASGSLTLAATETLPSSPSVGRIAAVVSPSGTVEDIGGHPPAGKATELPLSWSPDGDYLAARSLDGEPTAPTRERLVVIGPSGARTYVAPTAGYLQFIGWLGAT